MVLQAVFFDAGNTLLYEKPSRFEIYAQAARRRGLDIASEGMRDLMVRAHQELPREIDGAYRYSEVWFSSYIRKIFHQELGLSSRDLAGVSEELFARFSDPSTFALFPGTIELLEGLRRRGLAVGIISNWSQRLPGILDRMGVSARVDFVLASAIERVEKPAEEIFRRACARAQVEARDALHAGDHLEKDIAGALRAGLRAIQVVHRSETEGSGCGSDPKGSIGSNEEGNRSDPATGALRVGSLWELAGAIAQVP
ncbi:MAG: HAD-IA family hydrolase [Planctomycetota bacterium]